MTASAAPTSCSRGGARAVGAHADALAALEFVVDLATAMLLR
jgi:hypothetical protein